MRKYIVSARRVLFPEDPVDELFSYYSKFGTPAQIHSVFHFPQVFSPLFGGRPFRGAHITDMQLSELRERGVFFDIPLSNHNFSDAAYRKTLPLLQRYHQKGNGIICTNDELARRVRMDFPEYKLRASAIKRLETAEAVHEALGLYDFVTLPPKLSLDAQFLAALSPKDRVIPFANHACAVWCNHGKCYQKASERNFVHPSVPPRVPDGRLCLRGRGYNEFDLNAPHFRGFPLFKLIPGAYRDRIPNTLSKPKTTSETWKSLMPTPT